MDQSLQVFVKVVEKGNFSKAAEELHMTQPAVSQHIQSLEREMGVKLLERTNKFVRMNAYGEIVYTYAKEILTLHRKMKRLIEDRNNLPSGDLKIGASYTIGEYVLPSILSKLRQRYPDIRPKIVIGNSEKISNQVAKGQIDVGLIESNHIRKDVIATPFAKDTLHMYISPTHPLAKMNPAPKEALEKVPWIVREKGSGTREVANQLLQLLRLEEVEIMEFGSTQVIKESVEAGLGITVLSEWAVRKEMVLGSLMILPNQYTPFFRTFSIIKPISSFETKAASVFTELVIEEMEGQSD
ncbi:LysR family transcriptional regulator [Fervidibacillus halotolerans]|uniref:LysR family transcriptional regulator n=1 Tax=Fervidibacillus halotolerans TaxID=2980027 RepID=A0A9E8M1E5_9BACI|nr:LysR family transcriptional regulator [Fervidibacillus halotolerans]WAA12716.1 LysR family transcriptional regulator [Fervidibacillus halotolerans]